MDPFQQIWAAFWMCRSPSAHRQSHINQKTNTIWPTHQKQRSRHRQTSRSRNSHEEAQNIFLGARSPRRGRASLYPLTILEPTSNDCEFRNFSNGPFPNPGNHKNHVLFRFVSNTEINASVEKSMRARVHLFVSLREMSGPVHLDSNL